MPIATQTAAHPLSALLAATAVFGIGLTAAPAAAGEPTVPQLTIVDYSFNKPGPTEIGRAISISARILRKDLLGPIFAKPLAGETLTTGKIGAGHSHSCAVKSDGAVVCWGAIKHPNISFDPDRGQLAVPGELGAAKAISTGAFHTCAIKQSDSTVDCWGAGGVGQTEYPNFGQSAIPGSVGTVSAISGSWYHTCAIKSIGGATTGQPVCWGRDDFNQTGGTPLNTTVTAIATGKAHTCALKPTGQVSCWGAGLILDPASGWHFGQSIVPSNLQATAIATGLAHTCAIQMSDGMVTCWGYDNGGQATVPDDLGPVTAISAGYSHTCAVRTDQKVRCWGDNIFEQLDLPNGLTATGISAQYFHTCALTLDGLAKCWGFDTDGRLQPRAPTAGEVTFMAGGKVVGKMKAVGGKAHAYADSLPIGLHSIKAVFAGDGTYEPSSAVVKHLVIGDRYGNDAYGTAGADTLYGMGGADRIYGRRGDDILDGGTGKDRIEGGAGKDRMTGGPGADTFVFRRVSDSPAGKPDVITDFKAGEGDLIDLSRFDGNLRAKGKQRFTEYRGARPFTGRPYQLRFNRQRNRLEGDTTGNGRANFSVVLQGVTRLPKTALKM